MTVPIGTWSYAAAAVAFLFLSGLLAIGWRGRVQGAALILGCVVSALWASAMAIQAYIGGSALFVAEVLEVAHGTAWIAFLLLLIGTADSSHGAVPRLRLAAAVAIGFCTLLIVSTAMVAAWTSYPHLVPGFYVGIVGRGVLAVLGMVLVEHLFRNAETRQLWTLKYVCFALGGMFAYDFFLCSDGMLFQRLDPGVWEARGVIHALVVPLVAISAARNPGWAVDVSVSRRVVFHSTALLGAGAYLLLMAVTGYYIRFFGGNWGTLLQATFLFGAVVLVLLILFSGTLRARLKVFVSKNFFSYRYDYREEWLKFTDTLSAGEPGTRLHERSVEAIAQLVESPSGVLWVHDDSGAFEPKAPWNQSRPAATEPDESEFSKYLAHHQSVVEIDDVRRNPDVYGNLELPEWLNSGPRMWLVVPLILHEQLLGFVVLAPSRAHLRVNWEVTDLLKTAGRQAAGFLGQLQAAQALLQARQFESFSRMSAFVVHDLKNLVAQLSLLLANAERHKHNPAFQEDMLETIEHSVEKMNRLLMQLRSGGGAVERPAPILLVDVLRRAVASKGQYRPEPTLVIADDSLMVAANADRLERVVGHLLQNAIEATAADGTVELALERQGSAALVQVRDSGHGMTEEFVRNGLFKPFETTKQNGMGIGAYESREYIRELGGQMEVTSGQSEGTTFRILLPLFLTARDSEVSTTLRRVG